MRFSMVIAAAAAALLVGCAAPVPPARKPPPVIGIKQPLAFADFQFEVERAAFVPLFRNWLGQETRAGEQFLIVHFNVENKTGRPQPMQFQPDYLLIDESGAFYEPHKMHTISINFQRPGSIAAGQVMNPNVKYKLMVVFEVPKKNYMARVIVPEKARHSISGIQTVGPYFLVDLEKAEGAEVQKPTL